MPGITSEWHYRPEKRFGDMRIVSRNGSASELVVIDFDHGSQGMTLISAIKTREQIPRAIPVNPEQINEARDWIRSANPSLDQIEQRADAEAW